MEEGRLIAARVGRCGATEHRFRHSDNARSAYQRREDDRSIGWPAQHNLQTSNALFHRAESQAFDHPAVQQDGDYEN
jgi:hypothetical protein